MAGLDNLNIPGVKVSEKDIEDCLLVGTKGQTVIKFCKKSYLKKF